MAFGRLKSKNISGDSADSELIKGVHVMPQRFYAAPKKKNTGLILIILAGILVIGGLGAAAYFLNLSLSRARTSPPATNAAPAAVNANTNAVTNANTNTNQPAVTPPVVTPEPTTTAPVIPTSTVPTTTPPVVPPPVNANTNVNAPQDNIPPPSTVLPSALDADNDGLTAAEEALFGTKADVADTDGDSFSDGEEVLNNYDPTRAKVTLANSGLISNYGNDFFSIVYPQKWRSREQAADKTEVLFISPQGEFAEVLVLENPDKLDLPGWYRQQYPGGDFSVLTPVNIAGLNGYRSPDQRNYYFIASDKSRVFLILYNVGSASELNYGTTFVMMVKNFKIK